MVYFASFLLLLAVMAQQAAATSMKIDFLDFGHVRTDPIISPTTLSDHVHTFYGATVARPETTYQDLRSAYGGTGTAVENQSLYWHPTIYKCNKVDWSACTSAAHTTFGPQVSPEPSLIVSK